jgi:hypothetical protein
LLHAVEGTCSMTPRVPDLRACASSVA